MLDEAGATNLTVGQDNVIIYVLVDPLTDMPRYVGQSRNPQGRYRSHISEGLTTRPSTEKQEWISSLIDKELLPRLVIIDRVHPSQAGEVEQAAILAYLLGGADLTNRSLEHHGRFALDLAV